ncbi:MAG: DMT family transporter [Sedimentitalea sp.]
MKLALLTAVTMVAFASNSILNRLAVDSGAIDPASFASLRVLAGAVMLCALVVVQNRAWPVFSWRARAIGAVSLAVYMVGFSAAYRSLDAGIGALILFGVVQIGMFAWTSWTGARPTLRQFSGSAIAFVGLCVVLWPSGALAIDIIGAGAMIAAGLGWAIYTLAGRGASDPIATTALNFALCLPLVAGVGAFSGGVVTISPGGIGLAILAGAGTSGLGYAMWYTVLPQLEASFAATLQLCVPVIAMLAGVVLLNETVGLRFAIGALIVLGGIAWSLRRARA